MQESILRNLLKNGAIILDLKEKTRDDAIRFLVEQLVEKELLPELHVPLAEVMAREKLLSTGITHGLAIPHAKTKRTKEIVMAFGRSKDGVDFEAIDKKPSHYIFLILTPTKSHSQHVKVIARISRLFKKPEFLESVQSVRTPEDFLKLVADEEVLIESGAQT